MKWMLDTNICHVIDIIKGRPRSVLDRFKDHAVGDIGISVVTLAELEYGVSASSRPAKNRAALDEFAFYRLRRRDAEALSGYFVWSGAAWLGGLRSVRSRIRTRNTY